MLHGLLMVDCKVPGVEMQGVRHSDRMQLVSTRAGDETMWASWSGYRCWTYFFLMSILGLGFGGAMLMGHLMYNSGSLGSRQLLEIAACGWAFPHWSGHLMSLSLFENALDIINFPGGEWAEVCGGPAHDQVLHEACRSSTECWPPIV